jgi:hypothetical protein
MERAIERPMIWRRSKGASHISFLVLTRIKVQGQRVRIYCLNNSSPQEPLTRLPELILQEECRAIKLEKKVRVVRLPLSVGGTIKAVYVKQHNALSFGHRLASFFCASAGLRSLFGAALLLEERYATAPPVAAVEYRRWGVLTKSYYVSEEIAGAKTIADYWRDDLLAQKGIAGYLRRRAVLKSLACLLKSLHEKRIYHNDLKAANILALDAGAATEDIFNLIDLQGVRRCSYLSRRRRIKNLAQINRTLGNQLTQVEKLFFMKAYLGDRFSDQRKTRHLVRSILQETSRQVVREKLRQQRAQGIHSAEFV